LSRLTAGDIIPQVAIQPAASPIQLNVLPAPGQAVGGNTLQQLAQSLGIATSGVMAFGQAAVNQQNRQAVQQGQAIDFSEVITRGDNLNKSFKQIVTEMGLPDTANPYMMAAAESNFGSMVALKVRNSILSRMAELSDPSLDAASQSNLLRQIVGEETERWGGNRLAGNFYANNAFGEAVNEFLPGIEQQIGNEYLKNKESQALSDLESGFAEVLLGAMNDGANADEYGQLIAGRVMTLQRFTGDPAKVQGALYRATVTAFQNATSEDQLANIYDAALSIPYGQKGTVADNWGMRQQLTAAMRRAEEDMARRGDEEARRFSRNLNSAEMKMNEQGFITAVSSAIREGRDPLLELDSAMEAVKEGMDPVVFDALRERQIQRVAQLSANFRSIERGDQTQAINDIRLKIARGVYGSIDEVIAAADALKLDAGPLVEQYERYGAAAHKVSETIGREAQVVTKALEDFRNTEADLAPFDFLATYDEIQNEALRRLDLFIAGETDLNGKTYSQFREEGRNATDAALIKMRSQIMGDLLGDFKERLRTRSMAEGERQTFLSNATTQMQRSQEARSPSQRVRHVEATTDEIRGAFAQVYDALGANPNNRLGDPSRVANLLAGLVSQDGSFEVFVQTRESLFGGSPEQRRQIKSDGSLFRVFAPGVIGATRGQFLDETAVFSREELASLAINLKMQRLSGFTARDVLQNKTGVMDIPFDALKDRGFDWRNVPVFESVEELMAMEQLNGFTESDRQSFLRRVLGTQFDEQTVRTFKDTQRRLLDERQIYRNKMR